MLAPARLLPGEAASLLLEPAGCPSLCAEAAALPLLGTAPLSVLAVDEVLASCWL